MMIVFMCLCSLGAAEWLRPRKHRLLLSSRQKLEAVIPIEFGNWRIDPNNNVVIPPTDGSLADQLYDELLVRTYVETAGNLSPIMMLATYGRNQSDALQLHRPEICYPAVGFTILNRQLGVLLVSRGVEIPVVRLTAKLGDRIEDVVYWTRLGEALPQSAGEQRQARLDAALSGYIGDGVLIRASSVRSGAKPELARVDAMLKSLLLNVKPELRAALVGSANAAQLWFANGAS